MSSFDAHARRLSTRTLVSTAFFFVAAAGLTTLFGLGVVLAFYVHPIATVALAGAAATALVAALRFAP